MANRRDDRYDERWTNNPYRSQEVDDRGDYEHGRYGRREQTQELENRERGEGQRRTQWTDPGRSEREFRGTDDRGFNRGWEGNREWERNRGGEGENRHLVQGEDYRERFRDRPYSSSPSYVGHGGYAGHIDPYREGRDRGYGADSTGAGWGSGNAGRHQLGSLTESAAASATRFANMRTNYGQERWEAGTPQRISHAGKGPKGYRRSDERIREEVSEELTRSHEVDASNIEVTVTEGVILLSGTVEDRHSKRMAEELAENIPGVVDVQNQIRVQQFGGADTTTTKNTQSTNVPAESVANTPRSGSGVLGLSAEVGKR